MTTVTIPARFRVRRRTAADWTSGNEVLLSAEIGLETDTGKFKFGDGSTAWNSLAYYRAGHVPIVDAGGYFTGTDVEAALQEIGAELDTLATTAYVDAAIAGLSWKQAVRVATTAAGALASDFENGDTVDGVVLSTGDRILIKNQAAGTENGIYVVAASGAPARASDANSGAELVNASCYVSEGTTNADTQWTCTTNAAITVGVTSITFAQLTSGGGITALTGDVTASGTGSVAATLATAQPAVHTWALAQTFTVAPVFTDQSGSRTALGLGTAATQNTGTSGANVPLLNAANTWATTQTFTVAPVFTAQANTRTALGLGTAAVAATGTSGNTIPFLDGTNTWSANQTFSGLTLRNRIISTTTQTSVGQSHGGLMLEAVTMNTTNKYTAGLLFGSSDANFTTTNPKLLAGIVGYATEAYTADDDGGSGLEFFALPNNPGVTPALTSLGTWTVASGLTATLASACVATTQATSDDSTKLATTAFVHDVIAVSGGAMSLLGTATVSGAAATTLTLSGLDLSAYKAFFMTFAIENAAATASLSLYYNADTTAANYYKQGATFAAGVVTPARSNDAIFGSVTASQTITGQFWIQNDRDGRPRANHTESRDDAAACILRINTHVWTSATNVTSITISSSVASALAIGSTFTVWGVV